MIIATYNEIENLPRLVREIVARLPDASILVIDDNSPDGTGEWVERESAGLPQLHLIKRSGKLGLGSATITGLQWGKTHGFDLIATMDGDFSHSPEDLVSLVATAAQDQPDITIGSRYVAGGRIEGWSLFRHLTSRVTNGFVRIWLGLKTKDNTGAFRVYSKSALDRIELDQVQSEGYAYLSELLWRLKKAGAVAVESPITFRDRIAGKTKTNIRVGLQVFSNLLRLK